jgi:hypothetical protein
LKLQQITISQLGRFVQSPEFLKFNVIPITPVRAHSQAKNPKALPDDVVLTLAFSDSGELIGYIGALPDQIGDCRCAWNSGWWVKEGTPAEVTFKLFFSFLTDWNKKVLFSEMTPHTSLLIKKLRFCSHSTIRGLRGYSRFCLADVMPSKKPSLKNLRCFFRILDITGNGALSIFRFFSPLSGGESAGLTIEVVEGLSPDLEDFIANHNKKQPTKRYFDDFNWIQKNPWVVNKPLTDSGIGDRYFFSYSVVRFEQHWAKFLMNGELVALVCFTIRDKQLKLSYVFAEMPFIGGVGDYFYSLLKSDNKLCSITTLNPELANYLSLNKKFLYKTNLPKLTAISNSLIEEAALADFELQMGDGDCIFT